MRDDLVQILLAADPELDVFDAAHAGLDAMVDLLLTHGADPAVCNDAGKSAAGLAREAGNESIAVRLEGLTSR